MTNEEKAEALRIARAIIVELQKGARVSDVVAAVKAQMENKGH